MKLEGIFEKKRRKVSPRHWTEMTNEEICNLLHFRQDTTRGGRCVRYEGGKGESPSISNINFWNVDRMNYRFEEGKLFKRKKELGPKSYYDDGW